MTLKVGIDLGTTNSACAIINENGQVEYIKFDQNYLLPSCLFDDGSTKLIGQNAKNRGRLKPEYCIRSSKRVMGEQDYRYTVGNKEYTPEDVATEILTRIYQELVNQFGNDIKDGIDVVITVPALFRDYAIRSTMKAGYRAGFRKVTTLKEPISSVIAHGIESHEDGNYMVIDLGGGTLDISIVKVEKHNYRTMNVGGDFDLGGDDFTQVIQEMIQEEILNNSQYGYLDFSSEHIDDNPILKQIFETDEDYLRTKSKIATHAEATKIALSSERETVVDIPNLYKRNGQPVSFTMTITRQEFENKASRLFNRYRDSIEDALQKANQEVGIHKDDIDKIIFAGGSMNIPKAREIVQEIFNKQPLDQELDLLVAKGAALYKGNGDMIHITNRLAYNIGVEIISGELHPIIEKGKEYEDKDHIVDTKQYETVSDNQVSIAFEIYEGNYLEKAKDPQNKKIYSFIINGLRPQPKGGAKVNVTLSLTKEGMLYIHAEDIEGIAAPYDNAIDWNKLRKEVEE